MLIFGVEGRAVITVLETGCCCQNVSVGRLGVSRPSARRCEALPDGPDRLSAAAALWEIV
jgi:hypothetical protein